MSTNDISMAASAIIQSLFAARLAVPDTAPQWRTYLNSLKDNPFSREVELRVNNDVRNASRETYCSEVQEEIEQLVSAAFELDSVGGDITDVELYAIRLQRELETAVTNLLPGFLRPDGTNFAGSARLILKTFFTDHRVAFGSRVDTWFGDATDEPEHGGLEYIIRAQLVKKPGPTI